MNTGWVKEKEKFPPPHMSKSVFLSGEEITIELGCEWVWYGQRIYTKVLIVTGLFFFKIFLPIFPAMNNEYVLLLR